MYNVVQALFAVGLKQRQTKLEMSIVNKYQFITATFSLKTKPVCSSLCTSLVRTRTFAALSTVRIRGTTTNSATFLSRNERKLSIFHQDNILC